MISKDTIERIRDAIDIVELVGEYVVLKKSGSNYKGLSPFTTEKTPSFVVSPAKNIFKCFSSSKGGDGLSFIMELEGFSYPEALKFLANRYSIEIEETKASPEEIQQRTERESLHIVLDFAKELYKKNLTETEEGKSIALSYFKERGFSSETIASFDLGYALDQWDALMKEADKKQYQLEFLKNAGLVLTNDKGRTYDRFRGRVTFPIHNTAGRVIAFGARILTNDKNQPKYINSPETDVYHKSNVLYGIYQAKTAIRNKDNCYLVEGYTDVISLYQAGVKNVVASSGTALTKEQILLVKRYTNNITVLYDGDSAGIKASLRGIDMILEQGMNVSAVVFPEGEDPDSYVRKLGGEAFGNYLESSKKDFITFKTSLFLEDVKSNPIEKAKIITDIVASIAKIPNGIQRAVFFKQCSNLLEIEESVLISAYNKIVIQDRRKKSIQKAREEDLDTEKEESVKELPPVEILDHELAGMLEMEKEMLRILLSYGNVRTDDDEYLGVYIIRELEDVKLYDETCKQIIEELKESYENGVSFVEREFTNHENEKIKNLSIDLLTTRYEVSPKWADSFQIYVTEETDKLEEVAIQTINRLKLRKIRLILREVEDRLKKVKEGDDIDEILHEHIVYKQMEIALAKLLGNVTFL